MFVKTMHDLMHATPPDIAGWCLDGRTFYIKSPVEFERVVLPQYFPSRKYASIVRQLRFYGFRQVADDEAAVFCHPHFQRGAIDLLVHIKRVTSDSFNPAEQGAPESAIAELRQDVADIKTTLEALKSQLAHLSHVVTARAAIGLRPTDRRTSGI